jgi:hypothetical protein
MSKRLVTALISLFRTVSYSENMCVFYQPSQHSDDTRSPPRPIGKSCRSRDTSHQDFRRTCDVVTEKLIKGVRARGGFMAKKSILWKNKRAPATPNRKIED